MRRTPLYEEHGALGAKIVDFNGWALPVQFAGIVQEHHHTRSKASLFDCSHMGEYRIRGRAAIEAFGNEIISDVSAIPVGRCRYGAILDESGGILDDLISFKMADDDLYVVTNAGPLAQVTERICAGNEGAEHVSYSTAKMDVQGPEAQRVLLEAGFGPARDLKYFNAVWTEWQGHEVLLSRTGYTGELGYELYIANEFAPGLWRAFLEMDGVAPAGLGARDTLRTEMGYGLSGQDFGPSITPLEAAMESFIAWDTEFTGKPALLAKRDADDYAVLTGIRSGDRRAPRHGFEIRLEGEGVGTVTSGTYGPSVGHGLGLARLPKALTAPGTRLSAGPKNLEVETARPPFYEDGTCRTKLG